MILVPHRRPGGSHQCWRAGVHVLAVAVATMRTPFRNVSRAFPIQLVHPLLKTAAAAEGAKEKGGSSVVNISSIASVSAVKTGIVKSCCRLFYTLPC